MTYQSAKPYFYGTGRRKKSVARVRLYPGTGVITVNGKSIDEYFGLETLKLIVNQPFATTDSIGKFDIVANVRGGGLSGQAGAIRHGAARALVTAAGQRPRRLARAKSQVRQAAPPGAQAGGHKARPYIRALCLRHHQPDLQARM